MRARLGAGLALVLLAGALVGLAALGLPPALADALTIAAIAAGALGVILLLRAAMAAGGGTGP